MSCVGKIAWVEQASGRMASGETPVPPLKNQFRRSQSHSVVVIFLACDWSFSHQNRYKFLIMNALHRQTCLNRRGDCFPVYFDLPYRGENVLFPLPERRVYGCSLRLRKES